MRIPTKAAAVVAIVAAMSVALPAAAASAHPARGTLKICAHDGFTFNVYAEGPSVRSTDLVGEWDECTDWSKVRKGSYDVGYAVQLHQDGPTAASYIIRTKRNGHVYYKAWNNNAAFFTGTYFLGETHTYVAKNKTTRIDIFVDLGDDEDGGQDGGL